MVKMRTTWNNNETGKGMFFSNQIASFLLAMKRGKVPEIVSDYFSYFYVIILEILNFYRMVKRMQFRFKNIFRSKFLVLK
jgi:hypothetical protein